MKVVTSVNRVIEIRLAALGGEKVSEYQRAWAYADLMLPKLIEAMNRGISRADVITMLSMATGVKRSVAAEAVCKKLKKIGYAPKVADDDDEDDAPVEPKVKPTQVKREVSKKVGVKQVAAAVAAAPAQKPVQSIQPVPAKPAPAPAPAPATSAPAESDQQPNSDDKWAHLRGNNIIVGKGFLGEEERWMTPEEIKADKDRRAAIERASIISAELSKKT